MIKIVQTAIVKMSAIRLKKPPCVCVTCIRCFAYEIFIGVYIFRNVALRNDRLKD